jgi:hypothetical protein
LIVGQWLLQRKRDEPAGEDEAGIVSAAVDVVRPLVGGVCGCLEVEEAGPSRLSRLGMRLVLHRTWEHSDATINELPLDAPGHVPWWSEPHPNTNVFAVIVHVLGESIRHAGHADILREGLDGRTGMRAENEQQIDEKARAAYCAKIEQAARSAAPIKA